MLCCQEILAEKVICRQGHSPGVPFPRILGIEAVGIVEDAPGTKFSKGDIVATAMGGMGRQFDGGYAEYTVVPGENVQVKLRGHLLTLAYTHIYFHVRFCQ